MAQPNCTAADLERASSDLDELIRAVRLGARDQRQWNDFEEQAQAIAARLRGAFRGRPEAPSTRIVVGSNGGVWAF